MTSTGGLQRVPRDDVENFQIPLPLLEIQKKIVAEIEAERALIDSSRELIKRMEKKNPSHPRPHLGQGIKRNSRVGNIAMNDVLRKSRNGHESARHGRKMPYAVSC